ncbi:MAG: response regulator [Acidobacteriota bacterium]
MPHLVLADDSQTIQKVVQLSFADEEIEIHSFSDGTAALKFLRDEPPEVLLADISLPSIDGYELCREVKQDPRTAHIPVILLAGTFEPFDLKRAEEAGFHSYLTKPFETSQLVELVKKLVQSRGAMPPPAPAPQPPLKQEPVSAPESASPQETGAEPVLQETPKARKPGFLFDISLYGERSDFVFSLLPSQCRPLPGSLERDIHRSPISLSQEPSRTASADDLALSRDELDLLMGKVMERLPSELRRILPEIAAELRRDS